MNFDKKTTLRNLKALSNVIEEKWDMLARDRANVDPALIEKVINDHFYIRGIMDDIECDRITEFPLVEKTNFMTGKTFLEEPDLPYFCSPSSETFWSS